MWLLRDVVVGVGLHELDEVGEFCVDGDGVLGDDVERRAAEERPEARGVEHAFCHGEHGGAFVGVGDGDAFHEPLRRVVGENIIRRFEHIAECKAPFGLKFDEILPQKEDVVV